MTTDEKISLFLIIIMLVGLIVWATAEVALHRHCKEQGGVMAGNVCIDKSVVKK